MSENNFGKEIVAKLTIVYITVVIFAMIIIGKVLYLQVIEHDKWINSNKISKINLFNFFQKVLLYSYKTKTK